MPHHPHIPQHLQLFADSPERENAVSCPAHAGSKPLFSIDRMWLSMASYTYEKASKKSGYPHPS